MEQLEYSYWVHPGLKSTVSVDELIAKVCKSYGITREKLMERTRKQHIVEARQIAMYLIYRQPKRLKLRIIGKIFDLNHATVLHAVKHIEELLFSDKSFPVKLKSITNEPIVYCW